MMNYNYATILDQGGKNTRLVRIICNTDSLLLAFEDIFLLLYMYTLGAFNYLLGNCSPRFRSNIHNIQLLLLAKYSTVSEFGIDAMIKPIVEDSWNRYVYSV